MKKRLQTALDELDKAFESLEITPLSTEDLGRIAGGDTDICGDTSSGVTCNFKCGPTQYWECGPTTTYTCDYIPPYCGGTDNCTLHYTYCYGPPCT